VVASEVTESNHHEKEEFPGLLTQVEDPIAQVTTDGAFDFTSCYDAIAEYEARAVIPPRSNAVVWDNGAADARDATIRRIAEIGRKAWKKESGYYRRSLAETGIFRLKRIFGSMLSSRTLARQKTEVRIRCAALNRMTALGMPESYKISD
jgi:transposase